MTEQNQFDVFLAHNSADKPQVRIIANKLKEQGLKPWLDAEQISAGELFQVAIQKAFPLIKSAAIFIGSTGLGKWQILELQTLISQFVDKGIKIIPVLLPEVNIIPDDLPFLKQFNWVSFKDIEDNSAFYNLIWGIIGDKPDEYLQNKLNDLKSKKSILEKEIIEIEQRLNALNHVDDKVNNNLQVLLDWLSERDRIAARYGALALNRFPDLQEEVMQKSTFDQFCLEISSYLELIDIAIKRDSNFFLYEPELMPSLVNPIYKSGCFDVYKETFRLIKISIPNEIEISIRNRLIEYIDIFLGNLQVYI